ncbi:ABC transporter substrate-binding protein [Bacteriovorax sp. DB6_IX]|uniref:substrate-binding periplasmic protein n=1 Tax=Bacteriovorax sp. DB6_IX TaxID=1353530 RepID=UPI00038A28C4|nr:transporter substrate-binding domain-containing protein [Bacteriovorax sp. DB6_IX]EQC51606.1 ABC transporter, substrate-binding protein, family 3 [Bacteriovorax sp. DB6_IX]
MMFVRLLIFILLSLSVLAQDNFILKIGTMDLPPYGWEDSKGKHGIIYELNEEIGKRSGYKYQNTILPFKRMLSLLKNGEIDLISSQAHRDSLEAGDRLAVQFEIDVIVATKKSSKIQSLKDLDKKRFVFHRSASYRQLEGVPLNIIRVNSYEQSVKVLASNRLSDAGVFSEPAFYYWVKELGYDLSNFGKTLLLEGGKKQWIIVRKDLPLDKRIKLKEVIESLYKERLYQKKLQKYGKPTISSIISVP